MNNAFHFKLKALFILNIFKFLKNHYFPKRLLFSDMLFFKFRWLRAW